MAVDIRPATIGDAEKLVPLFAQLGYPTGASLIEARLRELDANSSVLVAARESALLGFVGVAMQPDFIVGKCAIVLGLVVADGARNRGIGAELLRAAEAWAAQSGARTIVVRSNVIREDAHRFYEREGYRRLKSQHVYEKPLN
jgi:GNAT superfamily N-acetyltransferase